MRKKEIDRKFDEIVDFSGIEKFIDTPVKRYSSGMKVRLAFAVAAHLEPEILLIDEVLAVGDAGFQQKCIAKMKEVGNHGRTVLFVSHNLAAVTRLCPRAILLNGGRVQLDDSSNRVISAYMHADRVTKAEREWHDLMEAPGDEVVRLCSIRVRTKDGRVTEAVDISQPVNIEMEYEVRQSGYVFRPSFHFFNEDGVLIFVSLFNESAWLNTSRPIGRYRSTAYVPANLLSEGMYFIRVRLRTIDPQLIRVQVDDAVGFQIVDSMDGTGARVDWLGNIGGVVRPLLKWETEFTPKENVVATKTMIGNAKR